MSEQNFNKLPKWTQERIKELQRQRDTAVRALNEYCDSQTQAPFYVDELECTGEKRGPSSKRRYIQGRRLTVDWEGITLDVYLRKDSNFGPSSIELSWTGSGKIIENVALIPKSFQRVELVSKENMR